MAIESICILVPLGLTGNACQRIHLHIYKYKSRTCTLVDEDIFPYAELLLLQVKSQIKPLIFC